MVLIGVDADSGLTHTVVATLAKVNDVTQAHACLHGDETDVFGDLAIGAWKNTTRIATRP